MSGGRCVYSSLAAHCSLLPLAAFRLLVYLFDKGQTNMENYGVRPDILVDNTPEDVLAGRDRQLETAVQELLKELGTSGNRLADK